MKKYVFAVMAISLLLFSGLVQVQAEKMDYQKYGNIAIAVVKADYPGEAVTEYEYIGREKLNETDVQDSFKFKVKENDKLVNVVVKVKHSIQNNKLLNLTVEEVK
ncbi:DUF3889 domain-containing protein [Pseudoneobacillus rhizosphaerae]|uniref:DUF3889 domain-containing protein n=1 Tax=Pseudoneobacillus rhizosphaerae TaxID=2880968 RepID=A0A9C7LBU9_9BACI|nr:DUF3889 domain-containing protein [Pseudoneobacillus rhizosphaerae]CAG9609537.1 hypothetical protein NEOCIP111885_03279 [Pseudoneobacillus rhizosphaerae]